MLTLAQMAEGVIDRDTLEIERNAHTKGRRRAEITDELHEVASSGDLSPADRI